MCVVSRSDYKPKQRFYLEMPRTYNKLFYCLQDKMSEYRQEKIAPSDQRQLSKDFTTDESNSRICHNNG